MATDDEDSLGDENTFEGGTRAGRPRSRHAAAQCGPSERRGYLPFPRPARTGPVSGKVGSHAKSCCVLRDLSTIA
jgi:hypothetical protein